MTKFYLVEKNGSKTRLMFWFEIPQPVSLIDKQTPDRLTPLSSKNDCSQNEI